MIDKARRSAYTNCVRIFRGSPTAIREKVGDTVVPTYNKDLAYIAGKVLAMGYIKQAYRAQNADMLDFPMLGKFDPTNHIQARTARDAFVRAGTM